MQQTLGIQRQIDPGDSVPDRTSVPHHQTAYLPSGSSAVPEHPGEALQREELQKSWSHQELWCLLSPPAAREQGVTSRQGSL